MAENTNAPIYEAYIDKEDSWKKINKPRGKMRVNNENGETNQIAKTKVNLNKIINSKVNNSNWNQYLYYAEENEGYVKNKGAEEKDRDKKLKNCRLAQIVREIQDKIKKIIEKKTMGIYMRGQ